MASAMNNNLLSLASNEVVSQCVDSLRYSRSALARMLVDSSQQLSLPQLLHVLTSDDLLNKTVIPGIMSLDLTDEERCTKLFKCLEESMLSIPDAETRRNYIVQLLKTFIDNDLRGIALVIHKPLSIAVIQDVEGTYSQQSSDYGNDEDYRRYSMEENSAYVSPLQSSMSYPGATSTEPSAPTPGLELGPELSVSDESALHGPQRPLAIKVCYSDNFFGPLDGEESDDEIYRNCSSPRGLVFIANYTFSDSEFSHLQPREGSQRDVDNLREVFEQMGYCVPQVHPDLDKRNTLTALRKFRDDRRHNDLHSSVIVIMSHGKDDGSFYTNDGRTIKTSDVLDLFNSANCPALAAKFKLFIFQFCRGALHDWGAAKNVSLNIGRLQTDSAAQGRTRSTDVLPIHSDQFCIYPCVEGYVSLRHPNRGTWLMEALCDVFMNHAHEKDLNKLLQMVSKKIRANESDNGMKQTCESRARGIVKSFYFNPVNLRDSQNRCLAADAPSLSSPCSAALSSSSDFSPRGVPGAPELSSQFRGYVARAEELLADEPLETCESRLVLETMVKELKLHQRNELGDPSEDWLPDPTSEKLHEFRREVCSAELLPNNYGSNFSPSLEDAEGIPQSSVFLSRDCEHSRETSSSPSSGLGSSSASRLESSGSYLEGELSSARLSISSGFSDEAFCLSPGLVREDSRVSLAASSRADKLQDFEDQMMDV